MCHSFGCDDSNELTQNFEHYPKGEIAPVKSALLKLIEELGPEPMKVVFEAGKPDEVVGRDTAGDRQG